MIAEAASETAQAIPTRDDSRRIRQRESSKNVTGQNKIELLFDGQRPGMQQRLLALPGNPIAAVVAFIAVGHPMVDVVSGASHDPPRSLSIPAGFTLEKRSRVRQSLLAEVRARDRDESAVVPSDRHGTGMLSALTGSDGFIVLNDDREIVRRGERVDFLPMQAYLS